MADDYEELVELGFEGVDRFAEHFHDPVFGFMSKHKPFSPRPKKKRDGAPPPGQPKRERQRDFPDQEKPPERPDSPQTQETLQQPDLPPHPQWQVPPPPPGQPPAGLPYPGAIPLAVPYPGPPPVGLRYPARQSPRGQLPRQRSYSEPRGDGYNNRAAPDDKSESDSDSGNEREPKSMYSSYAPDRRRDGGWRNDDRHEKIVEDRECYGPRRTAQQVVVRTRDANRDQGALVPRAPSPPSDYGYAPRRYGDGQAARGRPRPRRQHSSSWSPPRRPERYYDSRPRQVRSKSPNHHRALAVVVGALVGGVAGSRVNKGDAVPNTMATVGGAIVGGIAARELEQEYDRHKERRAHQGYERGEARGRRRLEREYSYD